MKICHAVSSVLSREFESNRQNSRYTKFAIVASIALMMFSTACQQPAPPAAPDNRAADEAALKQWDENWSNAASAKDVDKTVSYYAEDALVLPPNGQTVTSKAEIRKVWAEMLGLPGFSGGWKATKIEVARSGELGYLTGTWEFKWNGADGKPTGDKGKFVEIVKKQADGSWKCINDIWNSDLPLPAPAAK